MGTLWPRVERKERKTRGKREKDEGGGKETRSERGAALAVHITLLTIRGQCHRVPSRGPTSLHLASLGSPFALLTGLPSASSFCFPPAVLPLRLLTPGRLSPLRLPRYPRARARARDRLPLPRGFPPPLYRRLLLRASTSPFLLPRRRSHPAPLLPVPPRPPPPNILIDRSCTRAQRSASSYRLVSSRLPRLASLLSLLFLASFFFLFPLSFCLALLPPPLLPSFPLLVPRTPRSSSTLPPPCPRARRGINYSKNLYCYYYRLTIPSVGEPETSTRVQYNARLCSRPADYVNSTTARAATATTSRERLVSLW